MINKQQILWGRTLLTSYSYLERICKSIDSLIQKTAVNSYYSYGNVCGSNSVLSVSKTIIELSNRKIDYINLKLLIEKAIKALPELYKKLVILKFVHRMPTDKACELLNISKRSSYVMVNRALAAFSSKLSTFGYSASVLEDIYLNDKFIKSIYDMISNNQYDLDEKAKVVSLESVFSGYIKKLVFKTV